MSSLPKVEGIEDVPIDILEAVVEGWRRIKDVPGHFEVRVDGSPLAHKVVLSGGAVWRRKEKSLTAASK